MNDTTLLADSPRILLVEDNAALRASMRRVLARAGLDVVEAGSGDAAAALIEGDSGFDMLVTDIRMPGLCDGVALASGWRARTPGRPVLFVSGHSNGRLDEGSLGQHEAVLHKPFQRASLLEAVRRMLVPAQHRHAHHAKVDGAR